MKGSSLLVKALTLLCVCVCDYGAIAEEPAAQPQQTRIVLRISREFIRRHLLPTIDETAPIDRCLFGAHVTGTSHTVGQTSVEMDISQTDAVFTFHFKGTTYRQQVATHEPVAVYSSGRADFNAQRDIHFDGVRFAAGPATIVADQTSTIDCVQTPRGLRGVIARRRAWASIAVNKPVGDQIALDETKSKVLASFDRETERLVTQLNGVVPYEKTVAFLLPKTKDWINHLGTTRDYLIISPGPKVATIATLPKEALRMRAPMELWVRGKPEGDNARSLLEEWTSVQRTLDRFRSLITGKERKIEGLNFGAVGEWWVVKIGEDLLEQWAEKIEEKNKVETGP